MFENTNQQQVGQDAVDQSDTKVLTTEPQATTSGTPLPSETPAVVQQTVGQPVTATNKEVVDLNYAHKVLSEKLRNEQRRVKELQAQLAKAKAPEEPTPTPTTSTDPRLKRQVEQVLTWGYQQQLTMAKRAIQELGVTEKQVNEWLAQYPNLQQEPDASQIVRTFKADHFDTLRNTVPTVPQYVAPTGTVRSPGAMPTNQDKQRERVLQAAKTFGKTLQNKLS